jgi:hypothetical protein
MACYKLWSYFEAVMSCPSPSGAAKFSLAMRMRFSKQLTEAAFPCKIAVDWRL